MATQSNRLHKVGQKYRQKSVVLEAEYARKIDKIYRDTLVSFLKYLGTRVRKNPASVLQDLLRRPDVVYNFQSFWDKAQEQVREEVLAAYKAGAELGGQLAQEEATILGLKVPPVETFDKALVDALLKDVDKQLDDLEKRFFDIATSVFNERDLVRADRARTRNERSQFADVVGARLAKHVAKAVVGVSSRAKKSSSTAVQRGMTDAHINSYKKSQQEGTIRWRKMWVASFVNNTPCPDCTKLHGTEIPVDAEFSKGKTPVYKDLLGPPRHVNCKCILVLYPEVVVKKEKKPTKVDIAPNKLAKFVGLLKGLKSKIKK